jgi:hypothetical protein
MLFVHDDDDDDDVMILNLSTSNCILHSNLFPCNFADAVMLHGGGSNSNCELLDAKA